MKLTQILSIALTVLFGQSAFASNATVRVPLIDANGHFFSTSNSSIPNFVFFTGDRQQCDAIQKLMQESDAFSEEMLWFQSHPVNYANAGVPVCYTGSAPLAMKIILNQLGDCVWSDQFTPRRRFIRGGIIHIENSSNDDGTDFEWSAIAPCR